MVGVERIYHLLVEHDENHDTVDLLAGYFGDFVLDEAQAAIAAYVERRPPNKVTSTPILYAADRRRRLMQSGCPGVRLSESVLTPLHL